MRICPPTGRLSNHIPILARALAAGEGLCFQQQEAEFFDAPAMRLLLTRGSQRVLLKSVYFGRTIRSSESRLAYFANQLQGDTVHSSSHSAMETHERRGRHWRKPRIPGSTTTGGPRLRPVWCTGRTGRVRVPALRDRGVSKGVVTEGFGLPERSVLRTRPARDS
ncbi:hypothetical protein LIA77_03913 [Sarocladium implicatum]|nr:hypothetical protein LIA77_03913 [Sarocladium implicatum]